MCGVPHSAADRTTVFLIHVSVLSSVCPVILFVFASVFLFWLVSLINVLRVSRVRSHMCACVRASFHMIASAFGCAIISFALFTLSICCYSFEWFDDLHCAV